MSRTKKIILLVLLSIMILGIIGVAAGFILGADPIQIGKPLLLQTADSFSAQFSPILEKLSGLF